jgi:succinylglutamate desuccinylase
MKSNLSSIALVACVHGDEIVGKKILKELKKKYVFQKRIGFFIAHPIAVAQKKRFIKQDLNRSFPGNIKGVMEEKIAHKLKNELDNFDVLIDIHATNSNIDSLVIVTNLSNSIKKILKFIPIKKIALVPKKVFGGKEMIRHHKLAVSLEYGPDKSGKNFSKIFNDVIVILKNLGAIWGIRKSFSKKEIYRVSGTYKVDNDVSSINTLKDFKFIKKGQIIGYKKNNEPIKSKIGFYPLFIGKGRYPKTIALTSLKNRLDL